ncbi:MAG: HD domain-containing protein [Phycisphaeraceae bacterium]|nr:HD domain-containing protein [Phycisphaeraceae bacterium]
MLRVPIHQVRPGMILAMPVSHPKSRGQVLLKQSFPVDESALRRLRQLGVRDIWIQYPNLDFINTFINPHIFDCQAKVHGQIALAFDMAASGQHAKLDYEEYKNSIRALLDKLIDDPKAAIFVQEMASVDDSLLRHSSTVCMLSLLMGLKMGGYLVRQRKRLSPEKAADVVNLGVGAMLHDIGALALQPDVLERWRETGDEEDPDYREHVTKGYALVRGKVDPTAAVTVLHHHQRFDGTGYPKRRRYDGKLGGLEGDKIHIFPRIVSAANIFDRLHHPIDGTGSIPTVRALKMLRHEPYVSWLDPMTFKALLAVVPPYPPGSLVKLSSGELAVVTDYSSANPCRPRVRTITDLASIDGEGEDHDLRLRKDLEVVESEGEDVREDNFYPSTPYELDLSADEDLPDHGSTGWGHAA